MASPWPLTFSSGERPRALWALLLILLPNQLRFSYNISTQIYNISNIVGLGIVKDYHRYHVLSPFCILRWSRGIPCLVTIWPRKLTWVLTNSHVIGLSFKLAFLNLSTTSLYLTVWQANGCRNAKQSLMSIMHVCCCNPLSTSSTTHSNVALELTITNEPNDLNSYSPYFLSERDRCYNIHRTHRVCGIVT